jgi:signal transduction histidine kinase
LARDLHDVVAHHVSLIAVRAETAPYTHPGLSDSARTVLTDIAADARLALDELRGVLGILGRAGEDASRAPQPTWRDIASLVDRTQAAGADVRLAGPVDLDVPPSVGYVGYRVVQEALTNARRHAPGAPVTLELGATSQLLTVRVSSPLTSGGASGSGQGLVGMRERVDAIGGRLNAGPTAEGFVVEAVLPRGQVDRG